jgi:acyl carrier protein
VLPWLLPWQPVRLTATQGGKSVLNRKSIRAALIEILEAEVGDSFQDVTDADGFREGLGLDSVDVFSVATEIEHRFLVCLTPHELESLGTFGELIDVLQGKLDKRVPA